MFLCVHAGTQRPNLPMVKGKETKAQLNSVWHHKAWLTHLDLHPDSHSRRGGTEAAAAAGGTLLTGVSRRRLDGPQSIARGKCHTLSHPGFLLFPLGGDLSLQAICELHIFSKHPQS